MGRQVAQGALFYRFRLDDHVPADHLLRRIDALFDLVFVRDALAASSSPVNNALRRRTAWVSGACKYWFSQGSGSIGVKSLRFRTRVHVGLPLAGSM